MVCSVRMKREQQIAAAGERARLLSAVRRFFGSKNHLEVETPVLAPVRIPESHIGVFTTGDLCLVPSPEVWMKRLLAAGFPSCFQITKSFRNGEQTGRHHNPEFTMLEWYTLGAGYMDSLELTKELLLALGFDGTSLPDSGAAAVMPVREAFLRYTGIDLQQCGTIADFQAAGRAAGYDLDRGTWEEYFHTIFLLYIEPRLEEFPLLFLYDYPVQIPCLAKKKAGTPCRERWELYIWGIEIANCFTEETDPEAAAEFMREEIAAMERDDGEDGDNEEGLPAVPFDADLPEISGRMPPCSGAALGIDRLLMILTGAESIGEVLLFPAASAGDGPVRKAP